MPYSADILGEPQSLWKMASVHDTCLSDYKYVFQKDILRDKVALITGGGSGIGFTITEILMRHGCKTAIASRNLARTSEAAQRLRTATGGQCLPLAMDVRKPEDAMKAVDEVLRIYGKIDFLVNNAAGNFVVPLAAMSYNAFKTVLDIDTIGTFNCSKTVFDKYFKDHGGVILNISATLPYKGNALQAHAGSAKAAIDALTKHMAVEWGPSNVRVVGLAPGPIAETEGMRKLGGWEGNSKEIGKIPYIPLERAGDKVEMAHASLFLLSDIASYITGTTLVADGGSWMTQPNGQAAADMQMQRATEYAKSRQSKL